MQRAKAVLVLLVALATLSTGPSRSEARPQAADNAPGTPPPAPSPIVERSLVELVLIEAYVATRGGVPVRDLQASDFVLKIDGLVKPIASVEYRELPAPSGGSPATPAPSAPEPLSAPGVAPGGSRLARRFVLFFDDETSSPQGLGQARRAAARFLETGLRPDDQVAVAMYRRQIRLLHDFTTDRAALARILETSADDPSRVSDFVTESEERTRALQQQLATSSAAAESVFRTFTDEETRIMGNVLEAMRSLVESLAPWPGYKAIIYLGDGIPENPGRLHLDRMNLNSVSARMIDAAQAFNLTAEFRSLVEAASGAGVTMHSVQTSGLEVGRAGQIAAASRRSNALETLSLNTGGVTSSSNDMLRALRETEEGSRAYYVIGYAPEGPPDGRYHVIDLRVKRSGLRLRWRRGYTRFLPAEMERRTLTAAHLLPGLYTGLGVDLTPVPGPSEGGTRLVDLVLHITPGGLLLLPESGRLMARLEVGLVVLGGSKETLRLARRLTIGMEPGRATENDVGINLFARVRLPLEPQTITGVVKDLATGTIGAARADLRQDLTGAGGVAGLSLYSLAEQSVWVEVRQTRPEDAGVDGEEPHTLGPALRTTFVRGEPLACGFRPPSSRGAARLRLRILAGDKAVQTVEVTDAPGALVRTVEFPSAGLAAGDYVLVVEDADGEGGAELGRLPFVIRAAEPMADSPSAASPS